MAACAARRPFLWDAGCPAPRATNPDGWPGNRPEAEAPRRPYSVLLPVGFTVPFPLPGPRWALTPPFHPYPPSPFRAPAGGLLSVALSLGSPPPDVIRHRCFHGARTFLPGFRRSDRPASWHSTQIGIRSYRGQARRSAAARRSRVATVEKSATPSIRSGRKWRWKARMTASVSASNSDSSPRP
jgi:hypothetical protein